MKTERREAVIAHKPRLVLAEGTQPYGVEPPPQVVAAERTPPQRPGSDEQTARRPAVSASQAPQPRERTEPPPSAGRYSHVFGRERR